MTNLFRSKTTSRENGPLKEAMRRIGDRSEMNIKEGGKKFIKVTFSIQSLASVNLYIQRIYVLGSHQLTKDTSKCGTLNKWL